MVAKPFLVVAPSDLVGLGGAFFVARLPFIAYNDIVALFYCLVNIQNDILSIFISDNDNQPRKKAAYIEAARLLQSPVVGGTMFWCFAYILLGDARITHDHIKRLVTQQFFEQHNIPAIA